MSHAPAEAGGTTQEGNGILGKVEETVDAMAGHSGAEGIISVAQGLVVDTPQALVPGENGSGGGGGGGHHH